MTATQGQGAIALFPAIAPTAAEAAALRQAARYLERAGTASASQLIGSLAADEEILLGFTLRDNLLSGAALCRSILHLFGAERE